MAAIVGVHYRRTRSDSKVGPGRLRRSESFTFIPRSHIIDDKPSVTSRRRSMTPTTRYEPRRSFTTKLSPCNNEIVNDDRYNSPLKWAYHVPPTIKDKDYAVPNYTYAEYAAWRRKEDYHNANNAPEPLPPRSTKGYTVPIPDTPPNTYSPYRRYKPYTRTYSYTAPRRYYDYDYAASALYSTYWPRYSYNQGFDSYYYGSGRRASYLWKEPVPKKPFSMERESNSYLDSYKLERNVLYWESRFKDLLSR